MKSEQRIEPSLFDLLKDVGSNIEKIGEIQDKKKRDQVAITSARDSLTTFVRNFFMQFFYEGYSFEIDSIDSESLDELRSFHYQSRPKPSFMIQMLSQFVDMYKAVMGEPYTREIRESKKLYCDFLPRLFEAFESNAKSVITNYEEIVGKINENLKIIKETC